MSSSDTEDCEVKIMPGLRNTFDIFKEMVTNKNTLIWFSFITVCRAADCIPNKMFELYLTTELGYPIENFSMMNILFSPLNIVLAFLSRYFITKNPFRTMAYATLLQMGVSAYAIFYIIGTFPQKDQIT